ncbi:general stress protein [Listeria monocytogenes]|nr:general stress protein [Listeria monocytogenes]
MVWLLLKKMNQSKNAFGKTFLKNGSKAKIHRPLSL